MTSQPGLQRIATHILLNISQIKGKQTMKFGQLIECRKRNNFLQKYAENEIGKPFQTACFLKKALLISLYFNSH